MIRDDASQNVYGKSYSSITNNPFVISTEEIYNYDTINSNGSITVGTDRKEVLNRMQTGFAREFDRYVELKESYIHSGNYEITQSWKRIRNKEIAD